MRGGLFVLALSISLAGCGAAAPQTPVAPVSTPAAPQPEQTMPQGADTPTEAILSTMAAYEKVIRDGDTAPISAITDSVAIRRFLSSAAAVAPPSDGPRHRTYRIAATREPFPGVVEAELARDDGLSALLLFRQRTGGWVLTEPTEEELGEQVMTERGNLRIVSYAGYPYTDEAVAAISAGLTRVEEFFGELPAQQLRVVLKPAFGVGKLIPFDVQALYTEGSRPQITLTTPWAINFRPYDPAAGWQATVQTLVAHEATHYVTSQSANLTSVNKAPTWVSEGLAEYVAAPLRLEQARAIEQESRWLPLDAASSPSLLRFEQLSPQERTVAYVQAQLLVAYVARTSQADLWAFIDAYAAAPGTGMERLDRALQASQGLDSSQLTRDWHAWVEQRLAAAPAP